MSFSWEKLKSKTEPKEWAFREHRAYLTRQILALLDRAGMSQRDLAVALGKSESFVSRLLSNRSNPTLRTIAAIAAVLNEEVIDFPDVPKVSQKFSSEHTSAEFITLLHPGYQAERYETAQIGDYLRMVCLSGVQSKVAEPENRYITDAENIPMA